jgi:ABC-2 type transport system permease protein
MYVFSGVFFSSERFPATIQPIIKALPLTALNDALRSVMTDGEPLAAQATRIAILAAWGVVSFVLALRWFRWQ